MRRSKCANINWLSLEGVWCEQASSNEPIKMPHTARLRVGTLRYRGGIHEHYPRNLWLYEANAKYDLNAERVFFSQCKVSFSQ